MFVAIEELTAGNLDAAASLLAARHRTQRTHEPLLSPRFEDPGVAREAIAELLTGDGARGMLASRRGEPVAYLIGVTRPGSLWGPNVWVEGAGHAAREPEAVRDLYAALAEEWVAAGLTAHYAVVPSSDPALVEAWSRLSFGRQHAHGIADLPAPRVVDPRVRQAVREDIEVLAELDLALPRHQQLSPVFSTAPAPSLEEARLEWEEEAFDDPTYTTFVAELDGRVAGSAIGCPVEVSSLHSGILCPEGCGFLGFAAVLPAARGHGLGRALGEAVGQWARTEGYPGLVTDWRETNLLSSRTWPRLGYRTSFLRMHRTIA